MNNYLIHGHCIKWVFVCLFVSIFFKLYIWLSRHEYQKVENDSLRIIKRHEEEHPVVNSEE